jgi:dihydrofolate reductase
MARFVFGMNVSLDGYVDHDSFAPDDALFRHWTEQVGSVTGNLYGRRIYGLMRYWDEDRADATPDQQAFADAWRSRPKWVVSRSLPSVGPNATLLSGDIEAAIRTVKASQPGEIAVAGPDLAGRLADLGLIDEYRLYIHPVVLGGGTPFFARPRPPLRLTASDRIGGTVIRLTFVPA